MATIRTRQQSDGTRRYTAIIRIRRRKTIIYQECKTFVLRTAAVSWAKHREVELEKPGSLYRAQHGTPTLAELIRWYIDTFETISKWQRSKQTHLEFLERHAIGKANALTLTSAMLIDHVRSRPADGAGPATVINDLIWIGVVLRAAKNVKELPVRPEITREASGACRELRLIGKPHRRARRPTSDELARLREYFASRDRRAQIPMQAIVDFAIASARREAEICRLEWRDNDATTRTGLVRDAKHPTSIVRAAARSRSSARSSGTSRTVTRASRRSIGTTKAISSPEPLASIWFTRRFNSADSDSPWRAAALAKRCFVSASIQVERCALPVIGHI